MVPDCYIIFFLKKGFYIPYDAIQHFTDLISLSCLIDLHFKCQDKERGLKINWKRVITTSLFGFGFVGPVGHFW